MKAALYPLPLAMVLLLVTPAAQADGLLSFQEQGSTTLPGTPSYYWWYGCSPTSAGMMLGFYDINGYRGHSYSNLVPGGMAEATTFPSTPGNWQYLAQSAIASQGNVHDYYVNGYNASGDDLSGPHHANNSLADFMGTSQDKYGNSNGGSTFYYFPDGTKFTMQNAVTYGLTGSGSALDAMYGLTQYVAYRGYSVASAYTQETNNQVAGGFSFTDYKNEIDHGRTVMIQVSGHSMLGFGYEANNTIDLYDTWSQASNTMTWGGSYSGMTLWGVTVLDLAVPIPGPGTIPVLLAGLSLIGILHSRCFAATT